MKIAPTQAMIIIIGGPARPILFGCAEKTSFALSFARHRVSKPSVNEAVDRSEQIARLLHLALVVMPAKLSTNVRNDRAVVRLRKSTSPGCAQLKFKFSENDHWTSCEPRL